MYAYINGKISMIESNYIVLDNNGTGYLIYTYLPNSFKLNEEYRVYIYQYVREDEISLYGFKDKDAKDLFLKLIEVKGLGCKMALPLLSLGTNELLKAIENEDIVYLKKFPKIGDKVARQIILDLKGKLVKNEYNNVRDEKLVSALKALGYKEQDIKKVLPKITAESLEEKIKEALKLF
jgi:Holliday junction DNA helicase RuvA